MDAAVAKYTGYP